MNKLILHIEGAAVLCLSLYFYSDLQFNWLLFFVLLLAPDLSMLGYLINNKVGAVLYNGFHTYVFHVGIVIFGAWLSSNSVLAIGLIWFAHIGMDRMVGFGLNYPTHFQDTHSTEFNGSLQKYSIFVLLNVRHPNGVVQTDRNTV